MSITPEEVKDLSAVSLVEKFKEVVSQQAIKRATAQPREDVSASVGVLEQEIRNRMQQGKAMTESFNRVARSLSDNGKVYL